MRFSGPERPRAGPSGQSGAGPGLTRPASPQLYLRELLRLTHLRFYQHLVSLGEDGLQMLFCHRWLLLCFKREFPEAEALRIWEACWAHYQVSRGGVAETRPRARSPSRALPWRTAGAQVPRHLLWDPPPEPPRAPASARSPLTP